jgi:hypothetical protein
LSLDIWSKGKNLIMPKLMKQGWIVLMVGMFLTLQATTVLALNKDDILRLIEAGLDTSTIVNVIRGTTEPLEITPEELAELEEAAIADTIIIELRMRLGIGFPVPEIEGPGSPSLQQELEEQQRLEAERQRLEHERMEHERQELSAELEAQREREVAVSSGYQSLSRARRLTEEGNMLNAASAYNTFLEELLPDPFSEEYYEAKFGLVQALYEAGLRSSIRADVLELALMGADRRHFGGSIEILREVMNDTGFISPRIADLSNEVIADLDSDSQDLFNYFLGRYYYQSGDLNSALGYLERVSSNGEYGARAAFLQAVVMISPEIGQNIEAVRMFQETVLRAGPESETDKEVTENAFLALARIAYQVGDVSGALYYYNKIPYESQRSTRALYESGWSFFLNGDMNRAVGTFHSLHSPYHSHLFFPDLYVLEAAAYLYTCNVDQAQDAFYTFNDEVGTLRTILQEFAAGASDPHYFYRAVFNPEEIESEGGATLPTEARNTILADADFYRLVRIIGQLEAELEVFSPVADQFGSRGGLSVSLLEADLNNRKLEAGVLIHDLVQDLLDELDDWWFKAQEVSIEIGDLEAMFLEEILRQGQEAITEGTTFVILADDWQFWPWESEYWLDEVGNYRGNLAKRCPDAMDF